MRHPNLFVAGALGVLAVNAALAQQPQPAQPAQPGQAAPRTRTTVVRPTQPAKITVGARGAEAKIYLTVQADNSDVRTTLTDMADKAGVRILLASSANGAVSGTVTDQPAETAIAEVAKLAGLTVRRIAVPKASATALTTEAAGRFAEALTGLPVGAVVTDPITGKSLSVAAAAPAAPTGSETVLYVQGRFSPEQERAGRVQRAAQQNQQAQPLAPANQDFVNKTAEALKAMPLQQRMEMMNALRRQMFESMSDEERAAMRGMGGPGGRGGWRGGDGGNRGDRGNGGNGGQNQ